ncbi:hypothetical protein FRC05_002036 [Tulasnella sp. 425]|nr:hypothetical protein FRC05_002036 [Tulasnella sp. 425]
MIYSPDTVPQYLASAASLIETVRLGNVFGGRPSFHLLGGETHSVQHLDLHSVAIHWDRSSFRKLKSLKLQGHVGESMTTDLFLEVLANNPSLEILKVTDLEIQLSETPSPPTIRLLQLRSMELKSLGFSALDHLLRHIEAPHCQEISIQGDYTPEFEELHKKNGSSKFYAGPFVTRWRSLGNSDDSPRFDVHVYYAPFASSLRWVERVLENLDQEGLEVTLDLDGGIGDPELMSTLRRLRCVTDICTSNPENSRGIMDVLSDPSVPSSQNAVPLLPSLRRLSVSYAHVTAEEILHMVRIRFAKSLHTTLKVHDLEISPSNRRAIWPMPSRIFNFATITEIRSIDGVTLNMYNRSSTPKEGELAVVWDEEKGGPTWGR